MRGRTLERIAAAVFLLSLAALGALVVWAVLR